jgi:hypothetical protein
MDNQDYSNFREKRACIDLAFIFFLPIMPQAKDGTTISV